MPKVNFQFIMMRRIKSQKSLIKNQNYSNSGAYPGMFIVIKQGIIKFAYYGNNMHDIPLEGDVLEIVR